jgi:hypothetical protein
MVDQRGEKLTLAGDLVEVDGGLLRVVLLEGVGGQLGAVGEGLVRLELVDDGRHGE